MKRLQDSNCPGILLPLKVLVKDTFLVASRRGERFRRRLERWDRVSFGPIPGTLGLRLDQTVFESQVEKALKRLVVVPGSNPRPPQRVGRAFIAVKLTSATMPLHKGPVTRQGKSCAMEENQFNYSA